MAYVPIAGHDIFISRPFETEEWTKLFEQDLKKQLEQWLPASELSIHLEKRGWQLGRRKDQMSEEAGQSAFFVATLVPDALSNQALRSLRQEWKAFSDSAALFGSRETRFALVLPEEIDWRLIAQIFPVQNDKAHWRPFAFFFKDKAGVPHTLARNSWNGIYRDKIAEVAWHLNQRLTQLKEHMLLGNSHNRRV
jgi:hypothetical protein